MWIKRSLGALLWGALTLVYPFDTQAQQACLMIFGPRPGESQPQFDFRDQMATYRLTGERFDRGQISKSDWIQYKKNFRLTLAQILRAQGMKIQIRPELEDALLVLPDPGHWISKLAGQLQEREVYTIIRPEEWREDSLGGYREGRLLLDEESLMSGRASFILIHELRHLYDDLQSLKEEGSFERAFLIEIEANQTKSKILPNFTIEHSYREGTVLDEVLAHRQSAALLLRQIQERLARGEEPTVEQRDYLVKHGNRIAHFLESWLVQSEILRAEIAAGAVKAELIPPSDENPRSGLRVQIVADPKSSVRDKPQDPQWIGLSYLFRLSPQEGSGLVGSSTAGRLDMISSKQNEADRLMAAILPSAQAFRDSVHRFDGHELQPVELALQNLTSTIARVRAESRPTNTRDF